MASYRQRGKNKFWDYRIFDKKGNYFSQTIQHDLIVRRPYMSCGRIGIT